MKKRYRLTMTVVLAVASSVAYGADGVFRVDDDAEGVYPTADGSDWTVEDAFGTIEDAILAALANDDFDNKILIAQGTYHPAGNTRTDAFELPPAPDGKNIALKGGYAGIGAQDPDERGYLTILSGDIGTSGDPTDNCYHVVRAVSSNFGTIVNARTTLDGVTIRDGYADDTNPPKDGRGGGITLVNSFPQISNCIVEHNYAHDVGGGGMSCEFDEDILTSSDYVIVEHCTFDENTARNRGAGVLMYFHQSESSGGSLGMIDCTITNNACGDTNHSCGGAFHLELRGGTPEFNFAPDVHFVNCRLTHNYARELGGAISSKAHEASTLTFANCVIADNGTLEGETDTQYGGGIGLYGGKLSLRGCTIVGNHASHDDAGAGLNLTSPSSSGRDEPALIYNSIFWENEREDGLAQSSQILTEIDLTIDASDVQFGAGNIGGGFHVDDHTVLGVPPRFRDAEYRLYGTSEVLNQGDDDEIALDVFDLDGDQNVAETVPYDNDGLERIVCTVDMGAFEWRPAAVCPDLDEDGIVGFFEVLSILAAWGNTGGPEDFDGSGTVDFGDVLAVLAAWGPCEACDPGPTPIPAMLDDMGLDYPEDWDDFLTHMEFGSVAEQDNYACWIEHYYNAHFMHTCLCQPNCPGSDPWGGH